MAVINCGTSEAQRHFALSEFQEGISVYVSAASRLPKPDEQIPSYDGNGFFIRSNGNAFLITNLHNIDTIDYYTKASHNQPTPQIVQYYCQRYKNFLGNAVAIRNGYSELFIPVLYQNRKADIAAIQVNIPDTIETVVFDSDYKLSVNEEVFTVSIIRTSSGDFYNFVSFAKITTDPEKSVMTSFGELPVIFTDKHSIPGMSGSPVFVWPDHMKPPIFVGILSGNDNGYSFFWKAKILADFIKLVK